MLAGRRAAQQKTEITFARFFGACEADYGTNQDVEHARGECGVMTTLVNLFNATNKDNIVVKPQIIEWGPYYQQLTARIAAHDIPTIAVMHTSQIGDSSARYRRAARRLLQGGRHRRQRLHAKRARPGSPSSGKIYALPWDTHSWLWHFNVGLFKQAGLVDAQGSR